MCSREKLCEERESARKVGTGGGGVQLVAPARLRAYTGMSPTTLHLTFEPFAAVRDLGTDLAS